MKIFGLEITRGNKAAGTWKAKEGTSKNGMWVKLGSNNYSLNRGYADHMLYEANDRAYKAFVVNPFVKRIIEVWVNYVVGEGLVMKANDETVDKLVVQPFVRRNKIRENQRKRATESYMFGELAATPRVNVFTGSTRLTFIDPLCISEVQLDPMDGDNPIAIKIKSEGAETILPIVYLDEYGTGPKRVPEFYGNKRPFVEPNAEDLLTINKKVGRAFLLRFNAVIGAQRGHSDLTSIIDWCAGLEDILWSEKDRILEQSAITGVMQVDGATPQQLNKYRDPDDPSHIPPPQSLRDSEGAWAYINDKIKISFLSPTSSGSGVTEMLSAFKSVIQIGSGNPAVVFGQADEATWASAKETTSPFYQMMQAAQTNYAEFWKDVLEFAVDQVRIFAPDSLSGVTDFGVEVSAPPIAVDDKKLQSEIAKVMTDMVLAWKANGAIDDVQFKQLVREISNICGLTIKDLVQQQVSTMPTKESETQKLFKEMMERDA